MTTPPPWGWRPEKVNHSSRYVTGPPPKPSECCIYWLGRLEGGSWVLSDAELTGPHAKHARHRGVYLWEWTNVLLPVGQVVEAKNRSDRDACRAEALIEQQILAPLREKAAVRAQQSAEERRALVTAILVHGGYPCTDSACILSCVPEAVDG